MNLQKELKNKIRRIIECNSTKNPYIWSKGYHIFNELPVSLRY